MNRIIRCIVALLLVPCLITDPALAAIRQVEKSSLKVLEWMLWLFPLAYAEYFRRHNAQDQAGHTMGGFIFVGPTDNAEDFRNVVSHEMAENVLLDPILVEAFATLRVLEEGILTEVGFVQDRVFDLINKKSLKKAS